ncbi:MAG: MTH938/NDUFAF3 family protein [Candidatus Omnitrophica bacterium]|nr:MTH938/NDUFAF3 family protein [Candidatus Omnitrophota bacterium]
MPRIERYRFGEIIIDGKTYRTDVIVYPGKIDASWWRKKGHSLCLEDIKETLEEKPEVIIIGIGASGLMEVLEEVKKKTKDLGIELIIQPTDKACQEYNKISLKKKTAACLHLTC